MAVCVHTLWHQWRCHAVFHRECASRGQLVPRRGEVQGGGVTCTQHFIGIWRANLFIFLIFFLLVMYLFSFCKRWQGCNGRITHACMHARTYSLGASKSAASNNLRQLRMLSNTCFNWIGPGSLDVSCLLGARLRYYPSTTMKAQRDRACSFILP